MSRTSVVAVVVAYNRQELLRRCLDSLAEQTVALTGTVVVDNASTDSSREVASTHPLGARSSRPPRRIRAHRRCSPPGPCGQTAPSTP